MNTKTDRRRLLQAAAATLALPALAARAQERRFDPRSGDWRTW